jgi:hypothetical protein
VFKKSKTLSKLNLKGFIILSNDLFEVKINSKAYIGSHAQRFIVYGNSIAFVAWVYFVIAVDDIVFISDIDDSTA